MIKKWLIEKGIKILIVIIVVCIGIWYLSSSIGGASMSYTSVDTFMHQLENANPGKSDIPGCFLCGYIGELFTVLSNATEMFWNGIVKHLWILMALGFGIFLTFHTINILRENATSKEVKDLTSKEPNLDFKKWFDKVWKTGLRVLIAGALIGALNWSGTSALRTTTNVIVTPVMYIGTTLSMAATGVISNKQCEILVTEQDFRDILKPVLNPFMCVMANLNTVMLAGAGGGFALMNYAWLGMGGGLFTWVAGIALVVIFLLIGLNLLFQVLTVIFKLIFIIIFMPLLLAAMAFEQVWGLAKGLLNSSISILINSAVSILKISLKICIIYAVVYFSASQYGFTMIFPPLLGNVNSEETFTAKSQAVYDTFSTCEKVALVDGEINKASFKSCFERKKQIVESQYPGAFDFMRNSFMFLFFMIGIAVLYFWVISPKIDALLGKDGSEQFDYGGWLKDIGKTTINAPNKIYTKIKNARKEEK